tara:strand:- start:6059 stop:7345 length:1287 start_codon:yes stop_codon:yes gene_type:complete
MQKEYELVILGLGLSGLSFYDSLESKTNLLCIEKNVELGGYTRTTRLDRFQFDYTGHFLHLKHFDHPSSIGSLGKSYKSIWKSITNKSAIYIDSKICDAPYQYNFGQLGSFHSEQAIKYFLSRDKYNKQFDTSRSLKDFFYAKFGQYMAEKFFIPYNEKLLSCDLSSISNLQVGRFFPKIDDKIVLSQSNLNVSNNLTYNSKFWYPEYGGIDKLIYHFERPSNITFSTIKNLNSKQKYIKLANGAITSYQKLITTISLKTLLTSITDLPEDISNFIGLMSSSSQYAVNIGLKKTLKTIDRYSWIYIPNPLTNVYRLGNFTFASPYMSGSEGGMSLYMEIASKSLNPIKDAVDFLMSEFGLNRDDIECVSCNKLDPGYVHFKNGCEQSLSDTLKWLQQNNIYCIGRYGTWDYISMEDCIISASDLARAI